MAEALLRRGASPDQVPGDSPEVPPPLAGSVLCHSCAAVELLLMHGADANGRDGQGMTPLHRLAAARWSWIPSVWPTLVDDLEVATTLLKYKASPFHTDCQ